MRLMQKMVSESSVCAAVDRHGAVVVYADMQFSAVVDRHGAERAPEADSDGARLRVV
jgi:hypothetical protein